jgi:hypothetical protein
LVAGEKNSANEFTGVVIGDINKVNSETETEAVSKYGVYGY